MNFKFTADRLSSGDEFTGSEPVKVSDFPINRPEQEQPTTATDGLDPATPGGPSPYNGVAPYGAPVTTDPLEDTPVVPGHPVPSQLGPDVDTNTLKRNRQGR